MGDKDLIQIKQLPVIAEQLQLIKAETQDKVKHALSLSCTEDTVGEVKKVRAALTKELAFWEDKRKAVKAEIMKPYEQFESVYKDCISDIFKSADKVLKGKIDDVESGLKAEKLTAVQNYFDTECKRADVDFISLSDAGVNVTLSSSIKKLCEQAKAFLDKVTNDLKLISLQEHADEILYEYKRTLDVTSAVTTVLDRHKALEIKPPIAEPEAAEQDDEEDLFLSVLSDMDKPADPVIYEEPKTEYNVKFLLAKAEHIELMNLLNRTNFDYKFC